MSNVIGYKDTVEERSKYWKAMREVRSFIKSEENNPKYQKIIKTDKEILKDFLKHYVKKEAA